MTTLYKPVLIESAEQAEAMPVGTLARHSEGAGMDHAHKLPAGTVTRSCWVSSMGVESNAAMVGWTALVPAEAEEETVERHRLCQAVPDVLHRYTTPWTLYTPQEDPQ